MKTTTTLLAALFATSLSGLALAEEGKMPKFSDLDANGDGAITQEEAGAAPAVIEQWTALDANADGKVDEEEFATLKGQS